MMMEDIRNMPYVSVIVPVYNTKKYLAECLDSVCTQTYPQLEIIVVDDGSTDDSGVLLREYSQRDNRIRVITQKNQGLSAARNTGLEHSSGEYVVFLDSDDWIDDQTVDKAIQMITKTES